MNSWVVLAGITAMFCGLLATAFLVISGAQSKSRVEQTLKAVDRSYRVSGGADVAVDRKADNETSGLLLGLRHRLAQLARRLTPENSLSRLNLRLDQAGNPVNMSLATTMEYKGAGGAIGLVIGFLYGQANSGPVGTLLWAAGLAAAGFYLPNVLIINMAQKRQQKIRDTLPDIMDTLVVTVEAGLGFEAAVAHVVRNGRGPLAGEFARMLHEMQLGQPRIDVLRNVGARTTVPELKGFASMVVQATKLGVPLGNVLRQQSAEMRLRRRQRAEELAQKVPVKILFPMLLCIFPALFVVIIGPGIIRAIAAFSH